MSDHGEKTKGFYQNSMIFGGVLRDDTQRLYEQKIGFVSNG